MPYSINELDAIVAKSRCIYTGEQVHNAIQSTAKHLNNLIESLNPEHPPLVLCVMNGGLLVTGQLTPLLEFPVQIDYIHATRYRNTTQGHELEWKVYPQHELNNRIVIIIDDILDEGYTLDAIREYCVKQKASHVRTCVLVTKQHDRCKPGVKADYSALNVDDVYVFGFGMDYKGHLRNLNGIYAINE